MKPALRIVAICALAGLVGCAARQPRSGENYYVDATQEYSEHFYQPAIDNYQKLIDQYPFSPYAEEAELNIGLAYYKMHNYAESVGSLNDFLRMHPTSKRLDIASYYLAMAHYDQMGRPDQDQTHTQLALEEFESIERRFPESDFAALAQQQVVICREMLARHEYLIGNFYYKRANYKAAESRMAELVALYPDTPIAPEALYDLGRTLEKQGKKYSAAQAFTALKTHFPGTRYASDADRELKSLKQPIDTEEDPLKLVLAESGYGEDAINSDHVAVHESLANLASAGNPAYGPDGLPILDRGAAAGGASGVAPSALKAIPGPATLQEIRLSSSDPPLSVIFDLTGPVNFDDKIDHGSDYSTLKIFLKAVTPDSKLVRHMVFDRSIFRDCDVESDSNGTTVTVNTAPVSRFAIVPLGQPARLLVTFTPEGGMPMPAVPALTPDSNSPDSTEPDSDTAGS
jgi:outer membrane protein assembly factor BamD